MENGDLKRPSILAIPIALLGAFLLSETAAFRTLGWIASLPFHEVGHAFVANLSGTFAIPTPFFSVHLSERSFFIAALWFALLLFCLRKALRSQHSGLALLMSCILTFQLGLNLALNSGSIEALIIFGGLAGEMLLAVPTLLMFHSRMPEKFNWPKNRYVFLVVGATSLMHATRLWLRAMHDASALPMGALLDFGAITSGESSGDLDRLRRDYGWTSTNIVSSYLWTLRISYGLLVISWLGIALTQWHVVGQPIALINKLSLRFSGSKR